MDTSKEYVKMCTEAKEIQDRRKDVKSIQSGDFFFRPDSNDISPVCDGGYIYGEKKWIMFYQAGWECEAYFEFLGTKYTWLPRQDQLQELLLNRCRLGYFIAGLHEFYDPESTCPDSQPCDLCIKSGGDRRKKYASMEQWWLAFVMFELYNKEWDGEAWSTTLLHQF